MKSGTNQYKLYVQEERDELISTFGRWEGGWSLCASTCSFFDIIFRCSLGLGLVLSAGVGLRAEGDRPTF